MLRRDMASCHVIRSRASASSLACPSSQTAGAHRVPAHAHLAETRKHKNLRSW